jgi:general secretion pathway protein C
MKSMALINKISLLATFAFSALLAVIAADVTVTFMEKSIHIPVKKEKSASRFKKAEVKKAALTDFKEIFELNVFQASVKDPDFFTRDTRKVILDAAKEEEILEPEQEQEAVPMIDVDNYELYGTMVVTPDLLSSATIYNKKTKKYEVYGLKEYNRFIDDIYEIVDITRGSIEIKSEGENVIINIKEIKSKAPAARPPSRRGAGKKPATPGGAAPVSTEGITKVAENRYVIDQRLYQSLTKDVSSLMTLQRQISFIPKMGKDNTPMGFEVRRITPGSLFQKIGIQRGDIVKTINGRVLNAMSVPEALQLLNEMKNETNINLDFIRRNKEQTIGYEVR